MNTFRLFFVSWSPLGVVLCLTVPSCSNGSGTEGDNPFAGTVDASPCKGDGAYADYLARPHLPLAADHVAFSPFARVEQALIAHDEMPIGLECLQWQSGDEQLQLAVSNFAGGCGINWDGDVVVTPGEVVIRLQNPACDLARCGNCSYDTDVEITASPANVFADDQPLHVSLELLDCKGERSSSLDWEVAASANSDGIVCRPIDSWDWIYGKVSGSDLFTETQLNLYAVCDNPDQSEPVVCTGDRACVAGYCVPSCESDADCPLDGALTCQDGACLVSPNP